MVQGLGICLPAQRFRPWSRKIPPASGQLAQDAATEPEHSSTRAPQQESSPCLLQPEACVQQQYQPKIKKMIFF